MVVPGGHAWLLQGACMVVPGEGGMCGCFGGAYVVAPGGHAWLLWGGAWCLLGGHAWLFPGGMCGCSGGGGGMCGCSRGCAWFFDEIRSMIRRYTSYWNAFLY